ncbi:MAG: hypothetical protein ACI4P8_07660 [Akkermansia sp.]
MQNIFVRTTCIAIALIVVALSVGSLLADRNGQMVAFGVIAAIVGVVGFLVMGRQAWKLMLIAPLLCPAAYIWLGYGLAGVVGVWGLVLALFRHVQLKWNSLAVLDILVLLFTCCLVRLYALHPASLVIFGIDAQYIGGQENVYYLGFLVYYVAVSLWRGTPDEVLTVVRRGAYLAVAVQVVWGLYGVFLRLGGSVGFFDERNGAFLGLGIFLVFYAYASLPMARLWKAPKEIFLGLLGMFFLLWSGSRDALGRAGLACVFLCFLKKEFVSALACFALLLSGITALGEAGVLRTLPYPVQRVISLVPWAKTDKAARRSGEDTIVTRLMIWRYALDHRTGMIGDYVWGDGFQKETSVFIRHQISELRMRTAGGAYSAEEWAMVLAKGGSLHNMALTCIHRTGYIGLVFVVLISLTYLFMVMRVSQALRYSRDYPFVMMVSLSLVGLIFAIPWGTFTYREFFLIFYELGLLKVVYCSLREKGEIRPLFIRSYYVPLMLREMGTASDVR